MDEIICPHCGYMSDECDFPDLFWKDEGLKKFNRQADLLEALQVLGYNVVSCGNCGDVFIIKTKEDI